MAVAKMLVPMLRFTPPPSDKLALHCVKKLLVSASSSATPRKHYKTVSPVSQKLPAIQPITVRSLTCPCRREYHQKKNLLCTVTAALPARPTVQTWYILAKTYTVRYLVLSQGLFWILTGSVRHIKTACVVSWFFGRITSATVEVLLLVPIHVLGDIMSFSKVVPSISRHHSNHVHVVSIPYGLLVQPEWISKE